MIICLYPRECNWLISKKTIVIKIMCKLSFNDDIYGENAFLDLVNGLVMKISITQLPITLVEKFFRQNDP